jgi:arylsulfatase A-like enzyme
MSAIPFAFAALLLASPVVLLAAATPTVAKPNVVIIFMDDMGYADIGPFGATKQKTPNLDRMAREGMKLTNFYAAPVCSVSRAQLLTGCYGARVSVPGVYGPGGKEGLNPAEHTIAERMKEGADAGSAAPLRSGKGSTWEGGVRVPTLARWPGKIAPGSTCAAVAGTIDLLPTAVAVAGGAMPAAPVIDGRDISPLLLGKSTTSPREAHYYFRAYNLEAVRQGPWKLAFAPQHETMGKGVLDDASGTAPRLYNLDQDIGEKTNVAGQHPDIVAKLQPLAAKMAAEIGGNHPTARRPAGSVAMAATLYPTAGAVKKGDKAGKPPTR